MKKAVCVLGIVGLSTGAAEAQSVSTDLVVSLTFDRNTYAVGETGTAALTASWDGVVGSYFTSININLLGNTDAFRIDNVSPIAWNNPAFGFTGSPTSIEGSRIYGLDAVQFSLIPPPVDASNPLLITTISFTVMDAWTEFFFTAELSGAPNFEFPFGVTGPLFDDPTVWFGLDSFHSERLLIPGPGALALLGLGGLAAARRRR